MQYLDRSSGGLVGRHVCVPTSCISTAQRNTPQPIARKPVSASARTVGLAAAEKLPSNSLARLHMYVTLASRVSSRETGKPQASMRRLLGSSDYWSLRAVTRHKRPQNHNDIPVRRPHYATPQVSLSLASPLFYPPTTRVNEQRKKRKKKKRKEKKNPGVKKKKKKRFFFSHKANTSKRQTTHMKEFAPASNSIIHTLRPLEPVYSRSYKQLGQKKLAVYEAGAATRGSAIRVTCWPARMMRWPEVSIAGTDSLFSLVACFQISTSHPPRTTATRKLDSRLCAAFECW